MEDFKVTNGILKKYRGKGGDVVIPEGVTSIGAAAFYDCSSLTSVIIPESVARIGERAFEECSSLTSVSIPEGVTSIGDAAFSRCSSLTSISIPRGVKKISMYSFNRCEKLTSISIPDTVTSIDFKAFEGCISLTSVIIPESVKSIGDEAFRECRKLTSVIIQEGVTSIGKSAFRDCKKLTSVIIPESVKSIGDYAFSKCSSLTSVNIQEGVTSIGDYAFSRCSSLTSVSIPESVTSIGDGAFYGCEKMADQDGFVIFKDVLYSYHGKGGDLVIPESVTNIGYGAFSRCSSLTSVNIPEGVTSIGGGAFEKCSSLTSVSIPEGVTSIGGGAFRGCSSLTSVNIPEGVTSIGWSAFRECSSLTSVNIPEGVTSIGDGAFGECSSLTGIIIPESVTSIGEYTFYACENLASIRIPDGVTSIGDDAFYDCSSLTSINIPEGVSCIGDGAFYNCSNLTSISIPKSVKTIGQDAFNGCKLTKRTPDRALCKGAAEENSEAENCYAWKEEKLPELSPLEGKRTDIEREGDNSIKLHSTFGAFLFRGIRSEIEKLSEYYPDFSYWTTEIPGIYETAICQGWWSGDIQPDNLAASHPSLKFLAFFSPSVGYVETVYSESGFPYITAAAQVGLYDHKAEKVWFENKLPDEPFSRNEFFGNVGETEHIGYRQPFERAWHNCDYFTLRDGRSFRLISYLGEPLRGMEEEAPKYEISRKEAEKLFKFHSLQKELWKIDRKVYSINTGIVLPQRDRKYTHHRSGWEIKEYIGRDLRFRIPDYIGGEPVYSVDEGVLEAQKRGDALPEEKVIRSEDCSYYFDGSCNDGIASVACRKEDLEKVCAFLQSIAKETIVRKGLPGKYAQVSIRTDPGACEGSGSCEEKTDAVFRALCKEIPESELVYLRYDNEKQEFIKRYSRLYSRDLADDGEFQFNLYAGFEPSDEYYFAYSPLDGEGDGIDIRLKKCSKIREMICRGFSLENLFEIMNPYEMDGKKTELADKMFGSASSIGGIENVRLNKYISYHNQVPMKIIMEMEDPSLSYFRGENLYYTPGILSQEILTVKDGNLTKKETGTCYCIDPASGDYDSREIYSKILSVEPVELPKDLPFAIWSEKKEIGEIIRYVSSEETVTVPAANPKGKPTEVLYDECFKFCPNMKHIVIPETVKTLGRDCFAGAAGLQDFTIGGKTQTEQLLKKGKKLCALVSLEESFVCPEEINTISAFAFASCSGLKSITIPSSVKLLKNALCGCSSLTSVRFTEGEPSSENLEEVRRSGIEEKARIAKEKAEAEAKAKADPTGNGLYLTVK